MLSNPEKLEKIKEMLPPEALQQAESITFTSDSIIVDAPGVGSVALNIIEREEPKTIKFEASVAVAKGNMWIQLLPVTEASAKMKLTIKADVPFFMKAMVKKPLEEGIEKVADLLSQLPYQYFEG